MANSFMACLNALCARILSWENSFWYDRDRAFSSSELTYLSSYKHLLLSFLIWIAYFLHRSCTWCCTSMNRLVKSITVVAFLTRWRVFFLDKVKFSIAYLAILSQNVMLICCFTFLPLISHQQLYMRTFNFFYCLKTNKLSGLRIKKMKLEICAYLLMYTYMHASVYELHVVFISRICQIPWIWNPDIPINIDWL